MAILIERLIILLPVWISLGVHEWAHAKAAHYLGDPTAKELGRLTLNPLKHLDPIGTVLLPLLGVPFGWAKPVPFNPLRFDPKVDKLKGAMFVAAAGPASNIVAAILATLLLATTFSGTWLDPVIRFFVIVNVILASFNMIPLFPLDGSHIVNALIPVRLREPWIAFSRWFAIPLLLLVLLIPAALGYNLFGWMIEGINSMLNSLAPINPTISAS